MLISYQRPGNVPYYVHHDIPVVVIPLQKGDAIETVNPVNGLHFMSYRCFLGMLCVLDAFCLDSKVINHKAERDQSELVAEEARCELA